jgi:hypothetical protein
MASLWKDSGLRLSCFENSPQTFSLKPYQYLTAQIDCRGKYLPLHLIIHKTSMTSPFGEYRESQRKKSKLFSSLDKEILKDSKNPKLYPSYQKQIERLQNQIFVDKSILHKPLIPPDSIGLKSELYVGYNYTPSHLKFDIQSFDNYLIVPKSAQNQID